MRKIFIGLMLALLIGGPAVSVRASQIDALSIRRNHQEQVFPYQTKILRRNIHAVLTDRRFEYPERFRWLKKLWRKITGWFSSIKSARKASDNRVWQKIMRYLGFAGLTGLPFLLIFGLPKMFVYSRRVKNAVETGRYRSALDVPRDLKNEAGKLAAEGQVREAIRLLYLASLELLQKNRILPDSGLHLSDKANLHIVNHALGSNHPGCQAFQELVLVFQEKWFGLRDCRIDDYHRLWEDLKIMEATMGNPHGEA